MFLIFLNYALLASTFLCNKLLVGSIPPFSLTGLSNILGGSILCSYAYFKQRSGIKDFFNASSLIYLLPVALCVTFGATALRMYALSNLSSFKVTFFSTLDPFITALLCYILRSEKLSWMQLLGMTVAAGGSACLFADSLMAEGGFATAALIPLLAAFGAIVVNRYGWILAQDFMNTRGWNMPKVIAISMLMGGSLSLGSALLMKELPLSLAWPTVLPMLAYAVIVNNVICSSTYGFLLKKYSVTFLSLAEFLGPLFVALYGWLFLGESVSTSFFISIALVALGLFMFSKSAAKQLLAE
ncbi:DMT family transporter [Candidatus Dependentiae bacterium]|nr:DMT family transporter [Candidatus Dependentiae bacterium]